MNYKIISEMPPFRPKIAKSLRSLAIDNQCLVFELSEKSTVTSTMSRLKRSEGLEFTSMVCDRKLKVWRIN